MLFLFFAAASGAIEEGPLNASAFTRSAWTENVTVTVSSERTMLRIVRPDMKVQPIKCMQLVRESNTVDVYGDYGDDDADYHCMIHFHPNGSLAVDSGFIYDRAHKVMFHLAGTQLSIPRELAANTRRALAGGYKRFSCYQAKRKTLRVGSTADRAWCAKYYGVPQRCREAIITHINTASLLFIAQFNIALRPELVILPGDPGTRGKLFESMDTNNDRVCNVDIVQQLKLLEQFSNIYRNRDEFGIWHHFTGCRTEGILGRANIGDVCKRGRNVGVTSWSYDVRKVVYTVCHEVGHLFGAKHNAQTNVITIMDSGASDMVEKQAQDTPVQFTEANAEQMCGRIRESVPFAGSSSSQSRNHVPGNKCWTSMYLPDPTLPKELDPGIGTNTNRYMLIFGFKVETWYFDLAIALFVVSVLICCVLAGYHVLAKNKKSLARFLGEVKSMQVKPAPKTAQRQSVQRLSIPPGQFKTAARGDTANLKACATRPTNDNVMADDGAEERNDALSAESPVNGNRNLPPQGKKAPLLEPKPSQRRLPLQKPEAPQVVLPRQKTESPQAGSPKQKPEFPQPASPAQKPESPQGGSPQQKLEVPQAGSPKQKPESPEPCSPGQKPKLPPGGLQGQKPESRLAGPPRRMPESNRARQPKWVVNRKNNTNVAGRPAKASPTDIGPVRRE